MVERLKRFTSEADHHKVLDIAYLFSAIIGIHQLSAAAKALDAGYTDISIILLAIQMFIMSICGAGAYIWHIKGEVYKEISMIPMLIFGLATVMVGNIMIFIAAPIADPFVVSMSGLSVALGLFICIEMFERIWKFRSRIKQIRISQHEREISRTNPQKIINKISEMTTETPEDKLPKEA